MNKTITNSEDFERIYLPKHHKKKLRDQMTPEQLGKELADEAIEKIKKDFKKFNRKSKPYYSPCKCRHRGCDKRAIYIISDNESLSGFSLACAEHLHDSIINAFQFNEPCKPDKNLVTIRKISHLDKKLRDNYYIRPSKKPPKSLFRKGSRKTLDKS